MKFFYLVVATAIFINSNLFGQKWNPEIICSSETLIVEPYHSLRYIPGKADSSNLDSYKMVQCHTRSKFGYRVEMAVSNYYYGYKTTGWIGQHRGPNFNFIFVANKLNFGFRFKPSTIDPKKEIEFNDQALPTTVKLNNIKLDYYVGYSFDFLKLISVEPYVGYNRSHFLVINEDELNEKFPVKKTGGFIIGTTFNKYFKLKGYGYVSIFGTTGYGFINYEKINSNLDNGCFEWNLGLALKIFGTRGFNKIIE